MVSCSRCGQTLTNPKSKARGMGPVCARKADIPLSRGRTSSSKTAKKIKSKSSNSDINVSDSAKSVAVSAGVGVVLATNPQLAPVYKAYTAGKAGKKIYYAYNSSSDSTEKFKNAVKEGTKQGVVFQTKSMNDDEAEQVAEDIKTAVEDSGGLEYIAEETNTQGNEEVYGKMLEGSTKYALTASVGEATKTAMEVGM